MDDTLLYRRCSGVVKECSTGWSRDAPCRMINGAMRIHDKDARRFRAALLSWYDANRRDLPWRRTRDPYAIWTSEVMLQQTQVSRVAEYWPRFLARFPTVRALAEASPDDVLAEWSGLGYYRRARMLRSAARVVVEELGGTIPATARGLRRLPGMGAYTSAAVASIGFGEAVPAVDANAARVLARVLGLRGDVSRAEGRRAIESEAGRLVDPRRPGDFNQGVMELGALVCTPSAPDCDGCPVARFCAAGASRDPASYPAPAASLRRVELREAIAVVRRGAAILLERQARARGWWQGLWILPRSPLRPGEDPRATLEAALLDRFGIRCRLADAPVERTYTVTNHRVTAVAFTGVWVEGAAGTECHARWVPPEELASIALPAPDRAIIDQTLRRDTLPGVRRGPAG
jgi:A/G-specific adenine glycosylase